MVYVAILYEGVAQRLVRQDAKNDAEFFAKLNAQFGCYVCIGFTVERLVDNDKTNTESTF